MAGFLSMAPATPVLAAGFLGTNAVLSFIKGYTTTAAVGGEQFLRQTIDL
jgi:NAD(P) transhydrogenase